MDIQTQIHDYINSLDEKKRIDMLELHRIILDLNTDARLWYLDGKNEGGKIVSNPNIGYGTSNIKYADGKIKEFYKIGISANSSGISIYIMGIEDKSLLSNLCVDKIGKAKISSYCIKFKSLKDIDIDVLLSVLRFVL